MGDNVWDGANKTLFKSSDLSKYRPWTVTARGKSTCTAGMSIAQDVQLENQAAPIDRRTSLWPCIGEMFGGWPIHFKSRLTVASALLNLKHPRLRKPFVPKDWLSQKIILLLSLNTATLIADFKRGIGLDSRKGSKDLSPKRIIDDESAVIKCCDCINNWKNRFEDSDSLFSISSGIVACHEVEEDMFNAENIGAVV